MEEVRIAMSSLLITQESRAKLKAMCHSSNLFPLPVLSLCRCSRVALGPLDISTQMITLQSWDKFYYNHSWNQILIEIIQLWSRNKNPVALGDMTEEMLQLNVTSVTAYSLTLQGDNYFWTYSEWGLSKSLQSEYVRLTVWIKLPPLHDFTHLMLLICLGQRYYRVQSPADISLAFMNPFGSARGNWQRTMLWSLLLVVCGYLMRVKDCCIDWLAVWLTDCIIDWVWVGWPPEEGLSIAKDLTWSQPNLCTCEQKRRECFPVTKSKSII